MSPIAARALRHPRLLLVGFCLLCWLPGFFTLPATDRDEARFVQATRQMLETGDFVDIRNGAEARNRKPIGIHWLQAVPAGAARALGLARGNPVWPYRVASLLGALVAVLTTFAMGRRWFGAQAGPGIGLLAAAMLGGSALLTVEAHIAKTDAALLAATTLAMAVLGEAYLARPKRLSGRRAGSFWVALGVGILIKGPIAPMVAGLTVGALVLADRRWRWLGGLRVLWGVPLALAVVLPWLVAIEVSTHGAFLHQALGGDLGRKLAGGDDAHGAPPGYHLALLAVTLFPAGFLAWEAAPSVWSMRGEARIRFLLAWLVPAWLVFEITPTKLPHYPLPLFPPVCLLIAAWALAPADASGNARVRRFGRWLGRFWQVLACLVFAGGAIVLPIVIGAPVWLGLPGCLAALLVLAVTVRRAGRPARMALRGLCAVPLLWWAVLGLELPASRPLWVSRAIAARAAARTLAAVGYAEPSLMFEAGTATRFLVAPEAARWLLAAPGREVAVADPEVPLFRSLAGADRVIEDGPAVTAFDYSNGRRVRITLFRAREQTNSSVPP